jgi:uncharacterized protein YfbU (UPF0304 family)
VELSRKERWILSNQLRILEALYPNDADYYRKNRTAIEEGYSLHYSWAAEHIYEELSYGECKEVLDILEMHSMMQRAYERLSDREGIEEWKVKFAGFDGNDETRLMGYAQYFVEELGRYSDLDIEDFNSHMPSIGGYRLMLLAWKESTDVHHLTKEDLIRITSM